MSTQAKPKPDVRMVVKRPELLSDSPATANIGPATRRSRRQPRPSAISRSAPSTAVNPTTPGTRKFA
jgi:hypothetical protein